MEIIKGVIAGAIAALLAYFRVLCVPMIVLILAMILDYVTGITSAAFRGELSSAKGVRGIVKKVLYLAIVAVGMMADYIITLTAEQFGRDWSGSYWMALLVIVWLIINEAISILENLGEMGLPIPEWLTRLLAKLKDKADESANDN